MMFSKKSLMATTIAFILVFDIAAGEWAVPFDDSELKLKAGPIGVILGAGPAGLMAAFALVKSGKHDQIIIIENRPKFSRFNMVNFFPESWPMLSMLGVSDAVKKIGSVVESFSFYQKQQGKEPFSFSVDKQEAPLSFDFHGPVSQIFKNPLVGLQIINLAELQNELSLLLKQNQKISLIRGTATVSKEPDADLMHAIEITHQHGDSFKTHKLKPDLIVIAEGAHSINRGNIGILLKPVVKRQLWCSGALSLNGIRESPKKIMQVIDNTQLGASSVRTFGIFQVRAEELFVNGQANDNESVDECLKRNAAELLNFVNQKEGMDGPVIVPDTLKVIRKSQDIIKIISSKAEKFSSGNNLILFGDAAGFGTPKGGVGLSLVTSVYAQALLDLLDFWGPGVRKMQLEKYNGRASEIVDYWHERIASDDQVL